MEAKNIVNIKENAISNLIINFTEQKQKRDEYISFQLYEPISSFSGRETELLEIHKILQDKKKLVICGLGGIGKTELIRAYCEKYQSTYQNNFIWINAETQNDIKKSFHELACELKIETAYHSNERNLKEIVKEEYRYFRNEKCLVIFDNAMCLKDVSIYFPSNVSNISVLLSSQNKEWGNVDKFELTVLTEDESIQLINSLCLSEDQEDVKTLVHMLQHLPLAIQQAAAYIIDQKETCNTYKIRDYIDIYEKDEAILAVIYDDKDAPFPDYSEQLYNKTICKTLELTLAKIKNEIALKLLYICAFLSPDNIEKSLFFPLVKNEDITELNKVTRVLQKYFLITVKPNYKYSYIPYSFYINFKSNNVEELEKNREGEIIFIHRVVQKIIRYMLKCQKLANHIIEEALVVTASDIVINGIHVSSILKHSNQTVCLNYYKNHYRSKEAFLCLLSAEIYFDNLKFLLNSDNDFDIKNSLLPIYVALNGSTEMMKFIVEKGANISIKNNNGVSPISGASLNNRLDMLSYLIQQGSSVNDVDVNGYTPLHVAVSNNNLDVVKFLVNKGASITAATNNGFTLLLIAARCGNLEIIKYLLTIGSCIDIPDEDGLISLHFAAKYGYVEILDLLLKNGAPADYAAKNDITSLHLAALNGNLEIVQRLLKNGAAIDKTAFTGFTALHYAVEKNHFHIVKYLTEKGSNVNISSDDGLTSLHLASSKNYIEIVKYLVTNGCEINSADIEGNTSLHYAAIDNNLAIVEYLLENKALIKTSNEPPGITCLHIAAREGHLDLVKLLIDKNVPVDISNSEQITPLHSASEFGHYDIVKYLVEKGADINTISKSAGYTCLYFAAENGFLDIVKYLANNGSNCDIKNIFVAIELACLGGHFEIVKFLVEKGISVNTSIKDAVLLIATYSGHLEIVQYLISIGASTYIRKDGETAIHLAAEKGYLDIIEYLKSQRWNMDVVSHNGQIPLHLACKNGHLDVIKYLVDSGSPINHACNDGNTPLHMVSIGGYMDATKYLVSKGANINIICKAGTTATDLAIKNNHVEVAKFLMDHGGVKTLLENQN